MKKSNALPTDSELEILQFLWANGPSSVKAVNAYLNKLRDVGYTTTLKIMQIMTDKALVSRDTTQRQHIYEAKIEEKETKNSMVKDLIDSAFAGSSTNLVLQALGSSKISMTDLKEIKKLIKQIEKDS